MICLNSIINKAHDSFFGNNKVFSRPVCWEMFVITDLRKSKRLESSLKKSYADAWIPFPAISSVAVGGIEFFANNLQKCPLSSLSNSSRSTARER